MTHDSGVRYQSTIGAPYATMMTSPASSSRQRAYLVMPQAASRSPCPGGGGGAGRTGWATRPPPGVVLSGIADTLRPTEFDGWWA